MKSQQLSDLSQSLPTWPESSLWRRDNPFNSYFCDMAVVHVSNLESRDLRNLAATWLSLLAADVVCRPAGGALLQRSRHGYGHASGQYKLLIRRSSPRNTGNQGVAESKNSAGGSDAVAGGSLV